MQSDHPKQIFNSLLFTALGALSISLLLLNIGVWAASRQNPERQTVPTRTPTPAEGEQALNPTATPAPSSPTPAPKAEATPTSAAAPVSGKNMVKNPSYESFNGKKDDGHTDAFANWRVLQQKQVTGTIEAVTGVRSNTALKLTMTDAPDEGHWLGLQQASGTTEANKAWELSAYVFIPEDPISCTLDIRALMIKRSSPHPIYTTTSFQYQGATYGWIRLAADIIAPSRFGTYDMVIQMGLVSTAPMGGQRNVVYIDDVVLREK
jgi:hypothetical protein